MSLLEKILALRPTNAAARLGQGSVLPLLNLRDLLRATEGAGALLCVPLPSASLLPGILRAARDEDAVLGLAAAHRPSQREAPSQFFVAVRHAAEDADHRRPVFLQAGPLRIGSVEPRAVEVSAGDVFRYVDAGFTAISLDVGGIDVGGAAAVAEIARAAVERELAVEVSLPRGTDTRPTRDEAARFLAALGAAGLRPTLLRIRATLLVPRPQPGAPEPEPDFDYLRELSAVAGEHGAAISLEDRGTPFRRLPDWTAAGVRKIDLGAPFARRALAALPEEMRDGLRARAQKAGLDVGELLAQFDDVLATVGDVARDRAEALSYADALDAFAAMGSSGTARRAIDFLAEQAGY